MKNRNSRVSLLRSILRICLLSLFHSFALSPCANAHVGSSGVILQKQAGKYQLLVSIQPPDVVPGTAQVTVFVQQGQATTVGARPVFFGPGSKGAPTYDELVASGTGRFTGELWLMDSGSSSIELSINGPDGKQQVVVPVMSVATATRTMPASTGIALAAMGLLLVVMMITIIGASNADGVTKPDAPKPAKLGRRRVVGMVAGGVVMVLLLTGWRMWWNLSTEQYQTQQLYRPLRINASVNPINEATPGAAQLLTIRIDTSGFGVRTAAPDDAAPRRYDGA